MGRKIKITLLLSGLVCCTTEIVQTDAGTDAFLHDDVAMAGADAVAPGDGADPCEALVADPRPGFVLTDRGLVEGSLEGNTYVYKGIHYGANPTGVRRWRPPEHVACWSGVKQANQYAERCPQPAFTGQAVGSEDCLALNIWSPIQSQDDEEAQALPVMFFIHGGSHVVGSASDRIFGIDIYDGRALAEIGPAIVVTINYRLGALGYLVHPALAAESEHNVSGNYGLLDQIAALKWVQKNIAAFGGDPQRVMVFGQSAGAIATCALVSSPQAKGLFSRALMISGNCSVFTPAVAAAGGETFVKDLKCADVEDVAGCLRGKSIAKIIATPMRFYGSAEDSGFNSASIDGWLIPQAPQATLAAGGHNTMPMIMTTTDDEYTTLLGLYGTTTVVTEKAYEEMIASQFGADSTPTLMAWYPVADYETPNDAWLALLGDYGFVCPTRRALKASRANQADGVWRGHFTHGFSFGPLAVYGAGHGMDVYFTFGHLNYSGAQPTEAEGALSAEMMGYWTRFAATGDPNGSGAMFWAAYEVESDNYLRLDTPLAAAQGVHSSKCDLWDTF